MANDRPTLEQLRIVWRRRVEDTEGWLAAAREEVRRLEEELRSQSMPSPDMHHAFQAALRKETVALENYAQAAAILYDLALHSTILKE